MIVLGSRPLDYAHLYLLVFHVVDVIPLRLKVTRRSIMHVETRVSMKVYCILSGLRALHDFICLIERFVSGVRVWLAACLLYFGNVRT